MVNRPRYRIQHEERFQRGLGKLNLREVGIGEDGGGYKGYGYATVVEILCAALQAGGYLKMLTGFNNGEKVPYRLGHFFIAIDISHFIDINDFKRTAGRILREIRSSKKMPGQDW